MEKGIGMSEKILEKVDKIVNDVLSQLNDKTLIFTEEKIVDKERFFEFLKRNGIECQKHELEEKEFYYLTEKCKSGDKELVGIVVTYPDIVYMLTKNEIESLKESIKESILIHVAMKSKAFYKIFVNRFLESDKTNFFIVREEDIDFVLFAMRSQHFMRNLKNDKINISKISGIYVIEYEPKNEQLPKYAFVIAVREYYLNRLEITFDVFPTTKETLLNFFDDLYEIAKEEYEEILKKNPKFKELIDEILKDEM